MTSQGLKSMKKLISFAMIILSFSILTELAFSADLDNDGIDDSLDNCPDIYNPAQKRF